MELSSSGEYTGVTVKLHEDLSQDNCQQFLDNLQVLMCIGWFFFSAVFSIYFFQGPNFAKSERKANILKIVQKHLSNFDPDKTYKQKTTHKRRENELVVTIIFELFSQFFLE